MNTIYGLAQTIESQVQALGDDSQKRHDSLFFKAYPGGYGEGDEFAGVKVPPLRALAKDYAYESPLPLAATLLDSRIHEVRFIGLALLANWAKKLLKKCSSFDFNWQEPLLNGPKSSSLQNLPHAPQDLTYPDCVTVYLAKLNAVNNWDLVDISAPYLLGPMVLCGNTAILTELSNSGSLWRERMALIATLYTARHGKSHYSITMAEHFLGHEHDLIHKAAGWVLRESGKKDREALLAFLDRHCQSMPRTMLRYAIEHLDADTRAYYRRGGR